MDTIIWGKIVLFLSIKNIIPHFDCISHEIKECIAQNPLTMLYAPILYISFKYTSL